MVQVKVRKNLSEFIVIEAKVQGISDQDDVIYMLITKEFYIKYKALLPNVLKSQVTANYTVVVDLKYRTLTRVTDIYKYLSSGFIKTRLLKEIYDEVKYTQRIINLHYQRDVENSMYEVSRLCHWYYTTKVN